MQATEIIFSLMILLFIYLILVICYYYSMNLNIQKLQTLPPTITHPFLITHISSLNSLIVAPFPPQPDKPNPKKKINFKSKDNAVTPQATQPAFLFDCKQNQWQNIQIKGKIPSRREKSACVDIGQRMVMFGGTQVGQLNKALNDLYSLQYLTWNWRKLFTMQGPPASPSPLLFQLTQTQLLLITHQVWLFDYKGVNWAIDKSDIPGGSWTKIDQLVLPFRVMAACLQENGNVVVLGWGDGLQVAEVRVQSEQVAVLQVEGDIKGKGQKLQVCAISDGHGLVIDTQHVCHVFIEEGRVVLGNSVVLQQKFDIVVPVYSQTNTTNIALSKQKDLFSFSLTTPKPKNIQPSPQQSFESQQPLQSSPNTARQVSKNTQPLYPQTRPLNPSPPPSQLPFLSHLAPLLNLQTQKRTLLQQKANLLQDVIKRAQGMVLALCQYGSVVDKQRHIGKVKQIRGNLEEVLKREQFLRQRKDQHRLGGELQWEGISEFMGPVQ